MIANVFHQPCKVSCSPVTIYLYKYISFSFSLSLSLSLSLFSYASITFYLHCNHTLFRSWPSKSIALIDPISFSWDQVSRVDVSSEMTSDVCLCFYRIYFHIAHSLLIAMLFPILYTVFCILYCIHWRSPWNLKRPRCYTNKAVPCCPARVIRFS